MYYRSQFERVFLAEEAELALGRVKPYWDAANDAWAPLQGAQDTTIVTMAPGNGYRFEIWIARFGETYLFGLPDFRAAFWGQLEFQHHGYIQEKTGLSQVGSCVLCLFILALAAVAQEAERTVIEIHQDMNIREGNG